MTGSPPIDVVNRFYAAEHAYMDADGPPGSASFADMADTLDPDVVLHQSPDLPWGGEFHGHAGYEDWARRMRTAFDRLEVADARSFVDGDMMVTTCRLVTRSRATGKTLDLPMSQIVQVRDSRIVEFRPFYWNVPAYCDPV